MEITEKQLIDVKSVLSYRTRVLDSDLRNLVEFVSENIDALNLNINGNIIFSVFDTDTAGDLEYINIEVLVPVSDYFKSNSKYVYKPYFRIENAVKLRHYGKYSDLKKSRSLIYEYLEENKLTPITNVYYKVIDNDSSSSVIDLYIGINSNIL